MDKIKCLLLMMFCMFALPLVSKADCNYEREAELSRIAGNVKLSYNYEVNDGLVNFTVNVSNITKDIYVTDYIYGKTLTEDGVFSYDFGGVTLTYNIYSNDSNCPNEKILSTYITLPSYNSFTTSEDCSNAPDFKYCQFWLDTGDLTTQQFESVLNEYYASQAIDETDVEGASMWSTIKTFITKYKWPLIGVLICIIILPILIRLKRRRM